MYVHSNDICIVFKHREMAKVNLKANAERKTKIQNSLNKTTVSINTCD